MTLGLIAIGMAAHAPVAKACGKWELSAPSSDARVTFMLGVVRVDGEVAFTYSPSKAWAVPGLDWHPYRRSPKQAYRVEEETRIVHEGETLLELRDGVAEVGDARYRIRIEPARERGDPGMTPFPYEVEVRQDGNPVYTGTAHAFCNGPQEQRKQSVLHRILLLLVWKEGLMV